MIINPLLTVFARKLLGFLPLAAMLLVPFAVSADHSPDGRWRQSAWNDSHVVVFSECGFEGSAKSIPIGDYKNVDNIGIERNQISSIIVPRGMAVEIFQKRKFQGHWYRINQNQACLKGKWDNRIAALRVVEDNPKNSYGFDDHNGAGHGSGNKRRNCHPYTLRAYDGNGAVRFVDSENQLKQFAPGRDVQGEVCGKGRVNVELAKKDRRADVVISLGEKDYVFERWSQYDDYRGNWYIKRIAIDLPKRSGGGNQDDGQYGQNGWGNTTGFGKRYSSGVDSGANWGNSYNRNWNKVKTKKVVAQQPVAPKAPPKKQCNSFSASGNHPDTGMRFLVGDNQFHVIGNGNITQQICHSGQVQIELAKKRKEAQVVANVAGRTYVFGANQTGDRHVRDWYRKYFTVQLP